MLYLVTGAKGFIGSNLVARLSQDTSNHVFSYDLENSNDDLETWLRECDGVFHLAGVNRPLDDSEYESGNAGFTAKMLEILETLDRKPPFIMTSSIHAESTTAYGRSKLHAEQALAKFWHLRNSPAVSHRLKNVFGKWCRPSYNSVVATFCHNVANDLPIRISDPANELDLVYIDDVVTSLIECMERLVVGDVRDIDPGTRVVRDCVPVCRISLGELVGRLQFFRAMRDSLLVPDFSIHFNQQLYATYLSYVAVDNWQYGFDGTV